MRLLQLLLAPFTLLFGAFCCFGFLASFEPVPHALAFKIGYASLAVASFAATGVLVLRALRAPARGIREPRRAPVY